MLSTVPRALRVALGVTLLLISAGLFTMLSDYSNAVGAGNVGMSWLVPIFPALAGLFILVHGLAVPSQ